MQAKTSVPTSQPQNQPSPFGAGTNIQNQNPNMQMPMNIVYAAPQQSQKRYQYSCFTCVQGLKLPAKQYLEKWFSCQNTMQIVI